MRKLLLILFFVMSLAESRAQQPDSAQTRVDSVAVTLNYLSAHPIQTFPQEKTSDNSILQQVFILSVLVLAGLIAAIIAALLFYRRRRLNSSEPGNRVHLEKKIEDLAAELTKMTRENEGLTRVIKEYNGIQHEFDSLRHGMNKAYKIRFYPGKKKYRECWIQNLLLLDMLMRIS